MTNLEWNLINTRKHIENTIKLLPRMASPEVKEYFTNELKSLKIKLEKLEIEYLEIRNKELRGNIDNYSIGDIVIDTKLHTKRLIYKLHTKRSKCKYTITNKTTSSIEVYIKKKTKKGINCKEWFFIKDFEKRFTKF